MRVGIAAALLAGALTLTAATQPPVVSVTVTVLDRSDKDRAVSLTPGDFRILEDGVEQPVMSVNTGPAPVSIAVVLDTSDRMAGTSPGVGPPIGRASRRQLGPDDEVALVTYERGITIAVPWTDPASSRSSNGAGGRRCRSARSSRGSIRRSGLMNEAKHSRRAVLVVSNAEQAASKYGLRDFVNSARERNWHLWTSDRRLLQRLCRDRRAAAGAPHSTVTIWDSRGAVISFDDLVRDSGGLVLPARTTTEAERSVSTLVAMLRDQYVLTFTPKKPPDDTYRRLKVELRKGGHNLRYATGYLAKLQ